MSRARLNSSSMDRVLLVTKNMPPTVGGMERLNWHMAEELSKVAEVHVIGPRGFASFAPEGVICHEVSSASLLLLMAGMLFRAAVLSRVLKPNIIVAGSGLTAPIVWFAGCLSASRTAAYLHGLDIATMHPLYRWVWLPSLRKLDTIVCNSRATIACARHKGIRDDRLIQLSPGVTMPPPDIGLRAKARNALDLGNRPTLIIVGRFTARKGISAFLRYALPSILEARPDLALLLVGGPPKRAIAGGGESIELLQAIAKDVGVNHCIRWIGEVTDRESLRSLYAAADVHIFPVLEREGDPEGFGMVALEAAANGLHTVAFATGGVIDAVCEEDSGHLVEPGRYSALSNAVLDCLAGCGDGARTKARNFARMHGWQRFSGQLVGILRGRESSRT